MGGRAGAYDDYFVMHPSLRAPDEETGAVVLGQGRLVLNARCCSNGKTRDAGP